MALNFITTPGSMVKVELEVTLWMPSTKYGLPEAERVRLE